MLSTEELLKRQKEAEDAIKHFRKNKPENKTQYLTTLMGLQISLNQINRAIKERRHVDAVQRSG